MDRTRDETFWVLGLFCFSSTEKLFYFLNVFHISVHFLMKTLLLLFSPCFILHCESLSSLTLPRSSS